MYIASILSDEDKKLLTQRSMRDLCEEIYLDLMKKCDGLNLLWSDFSIIDEYFKSQK